MGVVERVNSIELGIGRINDLLSTKKEFIGKQILNIIYLFIVLIVTGCLDFVSLDFHFERLGTFSFWGSVITKVVLCVCVFNIGVNLLWDTQINKSTELKNAISQYEILITYIQKDFEEFIERIFNPNEKRKAYISKINRQIYRLNKFSKAKDRLLYSSSLPERQAEKEKNKYCIKRKELDELKSDDFIEKNLDNINVKYCEVDPALFHLEIDGNEKTTGVKIKGSVAGGKVKASSNIILSVVAISMFTASFGLMLNEDIFETQALKVLSYAIKLLADLLTILWQLSRGMMNCKKIITNEIIAPYNGRNKVLQDYVDWRITEKKPDSNVYKELHKNDGVNEVEMTLDEFKKLTGANNEN